LVVSCILHTWQFLLQILVVFVPIFVNANERPSLRVAYRRLEYNLEGSRAVVHTHVLHRSGLVSMGATNIAKIRRRVPAFDGHIPGSH
jgi:hypothetical protein